MNFQAKNFTMKKEPTKIYFLNKKYLIIFYKMFKIGKLIETLSYSILHTSNKQASIYGESIIKIASIENLEK